MTSSSFANRVFQHPLPVDRGNQGLEGAQSNSRVKNEWGGNSQVPFVSKILCIIRIIVLFHLPCSEFTVVYMTHSLILYLILTTEIGQNEKENYEPKIIQRVS